MRTCALRRALFLLAFSFASTSFAEDYNALILQSISEMPTGGVYKQDKAASDALTKSITTREGQLHVEVNASAPSYCSGATYQVFLKTLQKLQTDGKIEISPATARSLGTRPEGSWLMDGHGVWGRWNANGPGTAGLFSDLDLGYNFSDDSFVEAKPGDFMKIFWKEDVGKYEAGHSVIFMGVLPAGATGSKVQEVCYWSSNSKTGYGKKCVPRSKMKKGIFSRLTKPENIQGAGQGELSDRNDYLASLLKKESSFKEAMSMTNTVLPAASRAGVSKSAH
jgi:hypothetical protein